MSGDPRLFPQLLRRLARDRRGTAVVEFAICATTFIALLMAAVQIALIAFVQQSLQTVADSSGRYILTGQATQGNMTPAAFKARACTQLPSFLNCNKLMIDVRKAADKSFASLDAGQPAITYDSSGNVTNSWRYDQSSPGDIMILRVMYLWNVQLGPLDLDFSNAGRGKRLLIGTMVFKSEQFAV